MDFTGSLFHMEMEQPAQHLYMCQQQWELLPVDSKKELKLDDGPKREHPGVFLVGETRYEMEQTE